MLSPEMIIYDEPTTGLDPYTSDAINDLIIKIKEEYQTAAIIITHDIKCARRTSDRMVILNEGKIIANGQFDELSRHPDEQVKLFFI
jgi:phospholipid/cholesterol/gamma-HCH transport system ATP-binding protein